MTQEVFYLIIWIWIGIGILTFLLLLKITAPYGRHSNASWGPMISNKVGWFIMELPTLIIPGIFFFTGSAEKALLSWIFYGIYTLHYIHRVFIFPFRLKTKGKKMPLVIVIMAIFFNLVNGFILGDFLGNFANYADSWIYSLPFIAGFLIFIIGAAINISADTKLISLRKSDPGKYQIPSGGLFNKISCPNHFGEIIEWTGYAIMMWNVAGVSFAVWTAANLIPRAISHHKWYKEKFPDYPEKRKAFIPFMY